MTTKDALKRSIDVGDMILKMYIGDLSDDDLRVRPMEGMNPIAWQLGHLISTERSFVEAIQPGSCPPLPDGFAEAHGKDKGLSDDSSGYLRRDEYLEFYQAQRDATRAVIDAISDEALDAPHASGSDFIPTNGAALSLAGDHVLMHLGQFVPVRRMVGKPVVM